MNVYESQFSINFHRSKKFIFLDNDNVDSENNYCIDYWISPHIDSLSCKIYINAYKLLINSNWNYVYIKSTSLNNVLIKFIAFYCLFLGASQYHSWRKENKIIDANFMQITYFSYRKCWIWMIWWQLLLCRRYWNILCDWCCKTLLKRQQQCVKNGHNLYSIKKVLTIFEFTIQYNVVH